MPDAYFDRVLALCRDEVARREPKMKWMWGEALLGYALLEVDDLMGTDEFLPFLTKYCDYYVQNPPLIDYADRVAPALITYGVQKKMPNPGYKALTDRALDYIRNEPRVLGDAVNHLGTSLEGKFYPKSIWVDSLMMFSVFPARYASETGDAQMLEIAARQPRIYSDYMQDPQEKLWYHSYWVKARRHHPKGKIFWGRGNGWVVCALPMILESIGEAHPEFAQMRDIFEETVRAVLKCENADHTFNTVLKKRTYRELSATALIAAGILNGVRKGYLPTSYRARGEAIFRAVVDCLGKDETGLYMPEISGPTIPLHALPYLGYTLTPTGRNWSYGIAALVFAAIAYQKLP